MSNIELKLMQREGRKLIAEIVTRAALGDLLEFIDRNGDVTTEPDYYSSVRIKDPVGVPRCVGAPAFFLVLDPYRLTCGYTVHKHEQLVDTTWDVTNFDVTLTVALLVANDIIASF